MTHKKETHKKNLITTILMFFFCFFFDLDFRFLEGAKRVLDRGPVVLAPLGNSARPIRSRKKRAKHSIQLPQLQYEVSSLYPKESNL